MISDTYTCVLCAGKHEMLTACPRYLISDESANDKGNGCKCQACDRYFPTDLNVPDELWETIKPIMKPCGGGLLCPQCILSAIENEYGLSAWRLVAIGPREAPE